MDIRFRAGDKVLTLVSVTMGLINGTARFCPSADSGIGGNQRRPSHPTRSHVEVKA